MSTRGGRRPLRSPLLTVVGLLLSGVRSATLARAHVPVSMLLWFGVGLRYCLSFDPLRKPFAIDNQIYFFMAERVASGVPPHVSIVDHKNALSSLVSGAAILVGRWLGADDALAARAISCAVAAGTVAAVWLLAYRLRGRALEAHLAALFMLVFVDFFAQGAQGVRPKLFMASFMAAGLASFAGGRLMCSGLLSGASFLCWQPALLIPACLAGACLVEPPRLRRAVHFGAGVLAAVVSYELYFLWHGALAEQMFQTYVMPTREEAWPVPAVRDSLRFLLVLGQRRDDWSKLLPLLLMGALTLAAVVALVRPRAAWAWLSRRPAWAGVTASAATALAFTFVNHQAYPDLFFLYPFFALTAALAAGAVYDLLGRLGLPKPIALVRPVLVLALAVATAQLAWSRRTIYRAGRGPTLAQQRELADQVTLLAERHGQVWAIGCVHLLALNRMPNFLPYGLLIDPNVRTYILSTTGGKPFVPFDADGNLPGVILVSRGGERKIMPWLPRLFEKVESADFRRHGITLWAQRRDIPSARILKQILR